MHDVAEFAPSRRAVLFTYLAQYLTVAVLLAGYLTLRPGFFANPVQDPYSPAGLTNIGLFAFCAVFSLWFFVPGIFDRSLARMRYGFGRLVCDFGFAVVGLLTLVIWYLLITHPDSMPRLYVPQQAILAAGLVWLPLYVHAFLFPGAAFARHDGEARYPAPEVALYRPNYAAQSHGTAATAPRIVEKPGLITRVLTLLLLAFIGLGFFGWMRPFWLPSAELQAFLTSRQSELLLGAAVFGAIGGAGMTGRAGGIFGRLLRKIIGALVVGAATVAAAPYAIGVGLPFAASYAMTAEPASRDVVVVDKSQVKRQRTCDYTATVSLGGGSAPLSICNVPPGLWDKLRRGDRLRLSGPGTRLGIRYDTITQTP